jgi:pimeloyl-ACP methyl ester carboxylesterase
MKTIILNLNNRAIKCNIEGYGEIPCLVVGAAGLFRGNRLASGLEDIFTFYFVDLWEKDITLLAKTPVQNQSPLNWKLITDEVDAVRQALKLDKVAVLGQSAGGAIALEYATHYPNNCSLAIPVAFSPRWVTHTGKKPSGCDCYTCECSLFSRANDPNRKLEMEKLNEQYQKHLSNNSKHKDQNIENSFIQRFFIDRPKHWKVYGKKTNKRIADLWRGYHPDVSRVMNYFNNVLSSYNFFNKANKLDVKVFWMLGLYDHSVPIYLLTDVLEKRKVQYHNIAYYITDSGHYPMFENKIEFNKALRNYISKYFHPTRIEQQMSKL